MASGVGKAAVTVSFDAWKGGDVAASRHEIEILAARPGPKLESVSSRLKAKLPHPNKDSQLAGVRYSPDGKRVVAGDYPGGIIQVWDAGTGRQLTRIETGRGYRGSSEYFFLTPDWKTIYVSREKQKSTRIERDGKRLLRWEFDGDVRAWDLDTGELKATFKHSPPRNILGVNLSPDGFNFLTREELPGEAEGRPKRAASIWDVKSGKYRTLPHGLGGRGIFSPDGRTVVMVASDDDGYATALKLIDVSTATEKVLIPISEKFATAGVWAFSPDGRLLVTNGRVYPRRNSWQTWENHLKFWDVASGKEAASFLAEAKTSDFTSPVFSPDGNILAAVNWALNWDGRQGKLYLFDVAGRRLARTVTLTAKGTKAERIVVLPPAFSPDGRWAAVITQLYPEDRDGSDPTPDEVPQPRIHLVDVAAGAVRETLVAPQGFAASACFSPDGNTLATGGRGAVLLWDLTRPPDAGLDRGGR